MTQATATGNNKLSPLLTYLEGKRQNGRDVLFALPGMPAPTHLPGMGLFPLAFLHFPSPAHSLQLQRHCLACLHAFTHAAGGWPFSLLPLLSPAPPHPHFLSPHMAFTSFISSYIMFSNKTSFAFCLNIFGLWHGTGRDRQKEEDSEEPHLCCLPIKLFVTAAFGLTFACPTHWLISSSWVGGITSGFGCLYLPCLCCYSTPLPIYPLAPSLPHPHMLT